VTNQDKNDIECHFKNCENLCFHSCIYLFIVTVTICHVFTSSHSFIQWVAVHTLY